MIYLLHCKGLNLRYSPGWGNPLCCLVVLYVREGFEREQCPCLVLGWLSVTKPATHKQIGPFWCRFLCGWVCVHPMTLWVSPTNPSVRLGVSQAPQVFTVRGFEALFPHAGTLCCTVCLVPQLFLLVYLHANVRPPGPPANTLPCILSTPPAHLHPSYWSG